MRKATIVTFLSSHLVAACISFVVFVGVPAVFVVSYRVFGHIRAHPISVSVSMRLFYAACACGGFFVVSSAMQLLRNFVRFSWWLPVVFVFPLSICAFFLEGTVGPTGRIVWVVVPGLMVSCSFTAYWLSLSASSGIINWTRNRREFIVPTLLAVVLTMALLFAANELPHRLDRLIQGKLNMPGEPDHSKSSQDIIRAIRPIAYTCLTVVALLILLGFVTEKTRLVSVGAIGFFLPILGCFGRHMFFLAGLGILRTLWLPFWPDAMHLGNIVYLPYIIIVYPFALMGLQEIGIWLSLPVVGLGFLIFLLGIQAWLRARFQGKEIVDSWIYRFSRHPQYLGWIVWSYGLMLFASAFESVMGGENPGAGLPWVITTLIIVCVALAEEIKMKRALGEEYNSYRRSTPFMLPVPKKISALITAPLRPLIKKDLPENRRELLVTFAVYLVIIILLSLPFVLLGIPGDRPWCMWPKL